MLKRLLLFLIFFFIFPGNVFAQTPSSWYMAGANPQRTSWVAEQVPANGGTLYPQWFKLIEPKVPNNFQIVAGNDMIFLSTARGLYAFDTDGNLKWVYPTEMPLGQSPTYVETSFATYPKRLYIPGLDHKIHCIDANPDVNSLPSVTIPQSSNTVQKINNHVIWTYEAKQDGIGAGFMTNPLAITVSNNMMIYAGNRDGYLYALKDNGSSVFLAWAYKTDGPITFSAAASYPNASGQYDSNTKIYFASNDSYAYAVNASSGSLVWKSPKLSGSGFSAYWPVVYKHSDGREYVLLAGSHNYRADGIPPGAPPGGWYANLEHLDREIFLGEGHYSQGTTPEGTIIGVMNNGWVDTSQKASGADRSITSYYQNKPWRRTYFVLDDTGKEANFDTSNSYSIDYAPFGWEGTQAGTRFPSLIMPDNNIYQTALYNYRNGFINQGAVLKWKFGTPLVVKAIDHPLAVDEPLYISAGGNMIYFNWWGGFVLGAKNTTNGNEQILYDHGQCGGYQWPFTPHCLFPGYDAAQDGIGGRDANIYQNGPFGEAGSYDRDGNGNPPVPYKGKVYWVDSNALLVLGSTAKTLGTKTTTAWTVEKQDFPASVNQFTTNVSDITLKQKLESEVQKIITAGHLYPGWYSSGMVDTDVMQGYGESLHDYFHDNADTLWVLSAAMPYLSTATQNSLKIYLTSEYNSYGIGTHIGYDKGSSRSWFDLPPEVEQDRHSYPAGSITSPSFPGSTALKQYNIYALWQYAKAEGMSATDVKNNILPKATMRTLPADNVLILYPYVHNAYLTGLYGYMQLQKMAGNISDITQSSYYSRYTTEINHRATLFSRNVPTPNVENGGYPSFYLFAYNASRNFMFLAKEVAQDLANNSTYLSKVNVALNVGTYGLQVPVVFPRDYAYWFISGFDDTTYEAIHQPMYDQTLFQAKANILGEKKEELLKYLDVPFFKVGDLFYIQNLVAAIEAPASGVSPTPGPTSTPMPGFLSSDINQDGQTNPTDLQVLFTSWLSGGTTTYNNREDINKDGKVNGMDFGLLIKEWMK